MITGVISVFGKSKPVVKNRWVILHVKSRYLFLLCIC